MRTSGSRTTPWVPAPSILAVMAALASPRNRADPVSSNTDSGSVPAVMCSTAVLISSELLPVPGPPSTRTTPPRPGASSSVPASADSTCGVVMEGMTPEGTDK